MNRADARGNGQYLGPDPYFDDLFLGAAERRFLSAERIVATEELAKEGPPQSLLISRLLVDGVIEAPDGAHFTSCVPDYERDEAFQKHYAASAKSPEAWAEFRAAWLDLERGRLPGEAAGGRATLSQLGALVDRADVCVVAIAECFRGDGEILANPIGTIPMIGGRLARATFEPDLAMTDGEARLIANDEAFEWPDGKVVEHFNPYRHDVRLGVERPPPRDHGRQPDRPVRQPELRRHRRLPAAQGAAARLPRRARATRSTTRRRTGCRTTPRRCSCQHVDTVCGVGYDRAAALGPLAARFHEIRRVVTNLARARLRDARPPHAAAIACTPASPSTRCRPPPASSWSCPTTCRRRASPPPTSSTSSPP